MQKELNHKVRKCFNEGIYNVARYTEIVLSIIILIVIALAGIRLIFTITEIQIMDMDIDFFTTFLANGLSLVVGVEFEKVMTFAIGVEFVKMLCRHSAQTVVEVLMFATARQMVVEHMKPSQTLIGVIAIAILFAIRKFLMTEDDDMAHAPVKKHADMNKDENVDEKE